MVGFNQGVKDRLKPKMNAMNTTSADDNEGIQLENLLTNLTPIYEFIQEMGGTEADFDFNEASKYEGALRDIIAIFRALSKNKTNRYCCTRNYETQKDTDCGTCT